jgi:HlyD family secretion protein
MYDRALVPKRDLDADRAELDAAEAAFHTVVSRQRAIWATDLEAAKVELRELEARKNEVAEERGRFYIRAPVAGTVEELSSISPGSFIQGGEIVAVISPEDELIAEIYVSSRDIGLIHPGQKLRLGLEPFDFRDWGTLEATVLDISRDYLAVDQGPAFRVRAELAAGHLELPSGIRGQVRKGMTLQARFVLAERTLLQLLRDDVGDWIDPREATTDASRTVRRNVGRPEAAGAS